jgi:hypothetical protein
VVDSLNYGGLVDPWASEGYHGVSGAGQSGCRVPTPGPGRGGFGGQAAAATPHRSAGRYPDGADTDSNCDDFLLQAATTLAAGSSAGATNIKVASVADFAAGQTIVIDAEARAETVVVSSVGTSGATTIGIATATGATVMPVASAAGFAAGQAVSIDSGANQEMATVAAITGGRGGAAAAITVTAPLAQAHAAGAQVAGSGITVTRSLTKPHATGAPVATHVPTPGAPNKYERSTRRR